ncbi:MAG: hypothetical protein AAGG08_10585, partial [Actinomycetota bacterium]
GVLGFIGTVVWLFPDRFPNSERLYRVLPRGVPNTLLLWLLGVVLARRVADVFTDADDVLVGGFLALSINGFLWGMAGVIGREGHDPEPSWGSRLAGAWIAGIVVLMVLGHIGSLRIPALLAAPVAVWWWWESGRPVDVPPDAPDSDPATADDTSPGDEPEPEPVLA